MDYIMMGVMVIALFLMWFVFCVIVRELFRYTDTFLMTFLKLLSCCMIPLTTYMIIQALGTF